MATTITNQLFVIDPNTLVGGETFYLIDNINGYIPGIQIDFTDGRKMWVINHAPYTSSYERRYLSYDVKEFEWSSELGWKKVVTGRFVNNKMIVDDTTVVNSTTGAIETPTLDENDSIVLQPGQTTQMQFYIDGLGKSAIFPASQQGLAARFQDLL